MDILSYYPRECVEVRNQDGDTLLNVAAKCGHLDIVSYLISNKIDINAQNVNHILILISRITGILHFTMLWHMDITK